MDNDFDFDALYREHGGPHDDDFDLRESDEPAALVQRRKNQEDDDESVALRQRLKNQSEGMGDDGDDADDDSTDDDTDTAADGAVPARCATCGESTDVLPPKGHKFVALDADGDDALGDGMQKMTFRCDECGAHNKLSLRTHKLVRASEADAVALFRSRYRRDDLDDDADDDLDDRRPSDPSERFKEAYFRHRHGDSPLPEP